MDDFADLEAELKALRPAPVSQQLTTRVAQELDGAFTVVPREDLCTPKETGARGRRIRSWNWLPIGLGLAAAAGFFLLARPKVDQPTAPSRTVASGTSVARANRGGAFLPSGVTQVVYDTNDEGLHFAPCADRPVRRIRSKKRETLHWQNPETGASLRVTYPSEEVTLTPVADQ